MTKKIILLLTCIIVVCFSLFNVSTVSAVYQYIGASVGVSSGWIQAHVPLISNVGHFLAYALLVLLVAFFYKIKPLLISLLILSLACGIEVMQIWTPKQQSSFIDIAYDFSGIAFSLIVLVIWRRITTRETISD